MSEARALRTPHLLVRWGIGAALNHVPLAILAAVCLIPFAWMVLTGLKPDNEVMSNPPTWIPSVFKWSNFGRAFSAFPFARFLANTLWVGVAATGLQVVTSTLAAYAFARLRFKGRNLLFLLYLGTLMVPQQVTIVPLFLLMRDLGWVNTFKALILPDAFSAFGVFLLRQFFLTIPQELEEAALIDGAIRLRILWQIIVPLFRPALATLAVFTFVREWNSFLWPLIVTNSPEMRVVSVGLTLFMGQYGTEWNLLMAAATATVLPTIVVFVLAQRYFVEGITLTGFGSR